MGQKSCHDVNFSTLKQTENSPFTTESLSFMFEIDWSCANICMKKDETFAICFLSRFFVPYSSLSRNKILLRLEKLARNWHDVLSINCWYSSTFRQHFVKVILHLILHLHFTPHFYTSIFTQFLHPVYTFLNWFLDLFQNHFMCI